MQEPFVQELVGEGPSEQEGAVENVGEDQDTCEKGAWPCFPEASDDIPSPEALRSGPVSFVGSAIPPNTLPRRLSIAPEYRPTDPSGNLQQAICADCSKKIS
mmetsp:Transcript_21041/g.34740  ORF Transcript_21041/g.34740 Transcript_21041/m.34740 type:complete len:102 (+) Transcript_21041:1998-2303(+)